MHIPPCAYGNASTMPFSNHSSNGIQAFSKSKKLCWVVWPSPCLHPLDKAYPPICGNMKILFKLTMRILHVHMAKLLPLPKPFLQWRKFLLQRHKTSPSLIGPPLMYRGHHDAIGNTLAKEVSPLWTQALLMGQSIRLAILTTSSLRHKPTSSPSASTCCEVPSPSTTSLDRA